MSVISESFSSFKAAFFEKVEDVRLFDCMEFNLVKVVLDGLRVKYIEKGPFERYLIGPSWKYGFYHLKRKTAALLHNDPFPDASVLRGIGDRPFLFIDHSGRAARTEEGGYQSFYLGRILAMLGADRIAHVVEHPPRTPYPYDFNAEACTRLSWKLEVDDEDCALRKALRRSHATISGSGIFSTEDLANISCAFQLFYEEFRAWKWMLKHLHQKEIFLLCHYHKEGAILAMRRSGRKITELQHGLISVHDIFYCFPEKLAAVRERALFPDRILVYGEAWKEILRQGAEFKPEAVEVMGYYPAEVSFAEPAVKEEIVNFVQGKKVILVTTQTYMHEWYIDYVKWLSADIITRGLNTLILVKPHPAEAKNTYAVLAALPNVKVVNADLAWLFTLCAIHVSIYSTTLYDALRYGKMNYTLYGEPFADYVNAIAAQGVAQKITSRTNPEDVEAAASLTGAGKWFAAFRPACFEPVKQSL